MNEDLTFDYGHKIGFGHNIEKNGWDKQAVPKIFKTIEDFGLVFTRFLGA